MQAIIEAEEQGAAVKDLWDRWFGFHYFLKILCLFSPSMHFDGVCNAILFNRVSQKLGAKSFANKFYHRVTNANPELVLVFVRAGQSSRPIMKAQVIILLYFQITFPHHLNRFAGT